MLGKITSGRITEHWPAHAVDRRYKPQQIDLFERNPGGEEIGAPAWLELPAETRNALTSLMARLILEHAGKNLAASKEAGHDV